MQKSGQVGTHGTFAVRACNMDSFPRLRIVLEQLGGSSQAQLYHAARLTDQTWEKESELFHITELPQQVYKAAVTLSDRSLGVQPDGSNINITAS